MTLNPAPLLHTCGAVKIDTKGGFRLKLHEKHPDAPLSPIFLNIRTPDNPKPGPLTDEAVEQLGSMLWQYAKTLNLEFNAVCGLPNAGTPLAEAFHRAAFNDGHYCAIIKLGKEQTVAGRRISGILDDGGAAPGDRVLVLDDLITAGDSKYEGIAELQKGGFKVFDVLVIVDREEGGSAELQTRGLKLWSLTTLAKLVHQLFLAKKISAEERAAVLDYLRK